MSNLYSFDKAERIVAGLRSHGYELPGAESAVILYDPGQPRMNAAAGECAPIWNLRIHPLRRGERLLDIGEHPYVQIDGVFERIEICSHIPVSVLLKTQVARWSISIEHELSGLRMTVEVSFNQS